MIGGLTGRPVSNSTGPGTPMPIPRTSAGPFPVALKQLVEAGRHPGQHLARPQRDVEVAGALGERRAGQVGHGHARVGGAQVGHEHHAGLVVEREHRRRPAAGGRGAARLEHEPAGKQRVHPLRHRRARQPRVPGEVGPGHGGPGADQAEELAGRVHAHK